MRRNVLRRSFLLALMIVAVLAPGRPAWAAFEAPPDETSVALTLRLDAKTSKISSRLKIHVPLSGQARSVITRLRTTTARSSLRYAWAVDHALQLGGVLGPEGARSLVGSLDALPAIRIAHGYATVVVTTPSFPVPWDVHPDRITLYTATLPPGVTLTARIILGHGAVTQARPLPVVQRSAGDLTWTFTGGTKAAIRVTIAPPLFHDGTDLTLVAYSLVAGLPFLLLLICLPLLRGLQRPPRRLAVAGTLLTAGAVAYDLLIIYVPNELPFLKGLDPEKQLVAWHALLVVVPGLGVVAMIGLPWRRGLSAIAGLLALSVLTVFTIAATTANDVLGRFDALTNGDGPTGRTYVVIGVAAGALLTAGALGAAWQWFAVAVQPVVLLRLRPLVFGLAAGAAGVTAGVQLLLAADGIRVLRRALPIDPTLLSDSRLGVSASSLLQLPYILVFSLVALLCSALVVWLGAELWRCSGDDEPDLESRSVRCAAALMFALAVVGLDGRIGRAPVPVAFLLALPLIVLALRAAARRPRARWYGLAAVRARAKDFLGLAAELAAVDELRATERKARRTELTVTADLPDLGDAPQQGELTEIGLYAGAGARERAKEILRGGWWIIAVPALYGTFILLRDSAHGAVTGDQPYGLLLILPRLVAQLVTWPAAAWLFVVAAPIIPGRNGVIKGTVAAAAYAVPALLAMWILGDDNDGANSLFTAAELVLFYVAIGLWLDFQTVRRSDLEARTVGIVYHLTSVRAVTAYAAPAALVLFTVVHGLATGKGASALGDLVANAPSLLPGSR